MRAGKVVARLIGIQQSENENQSFSTWVMTTGGCWWGVGEGPLLSPRLGYIWLGGGCWWKENRAPNNIPNLFSPSSLRKWPFSPSVKWQYLPLLLAHFLTAFFLFVRIFPLVFQCPVNFPFSSYFLNTLPVYIVQFLIIFSNKWPGQTPSPPRPQGRERIFSSLKKQ